jgi:hypothetical protein
MEIQKSYANQARPQYEELCEGLHVQMTAGETMTIDVLIGDCSGGKCGFSLYLVEQDKDYPKDPTGFPIFPLLQLV